MPEWLPKLTLPDLGVFLVTVALCLAAARVPDVGDFLGRLWLRWTGRPVAPPTLPSDQKPDPDAP